MTPRACWLVAGFLLLLSSTARADRIFGALGPVTERDHRVTVTLHRGYAVWDAERYLFSEGAGQAIIGMDLPVVGDGSERNRAVLVGLQLLDDVWRSGSLLEAEAARSQFFEGGGTDEAAALLTAGSGLREATLRVSGMEPGVRRGVGYRLLVPTRYEGGHYRLVLPATPEDERDIHSDPSPGIPPTIVPHGDGGALVVNGQPWPNGEPIRFDPRRGLELSLRPPVAGWTVDGALAVIPFGSRFLTHAHVEVVPELSQRPRGARVVIVLDRSRSLTDELADGARAAARAYLSHLPDAHVEVVTYAREATRRYGRFVSSAEARRDLASWRPQRGNGSELGVALFLARQILDGGASGRPRRIVVLTDGKMRHDLPVDALSEHLGDGAPLTQIVQLSDPLGRHQPRLTRDDGTDWMVVAESSGGLAWKAAFPVATETPPDLGAAVERLVRPTVLSSFELKSAPFLDASDLFVTSELGEGEGVSLTAMLNEPLPWLTVVGKRWHDEVSVTLPVHDAEAAVWAALAFGNDGLPLDDDALARLELARRGGAVTELTSYAVGRTAEPPPLERVGFGRLGRAHGFSTRCGMGRGTSLSMEGRAWLENALRQALYACGAEEHRATVAFETIGREIAQVDGATVTSEGAPASLASCLTGAAWALELPVKHFENRASRRWSVDVKAILP